MTSHLVQIRPFLFILLFSATMNLSSKAASGEIPSISTAEYSRNEDVHVRVQNYGNAKSVVGTIVIDQPPDKIWPIVVNPYEFRNSLCPRMKYIEVLRDEPTTSLMKVKVNCGIFPHITYLVESTYKRNQRVDFKRAGGSLKEFTGYWLLETLDNGKKSRVTYSLYVDPGIPLPQWLVREAIKVELPKTLRALRRRVDFLCQGDHKSSTPNILAAKPLN